MSIQYLIRVGEEKYLSHLPQRDGLLIVTSEIKGYLRHDKTGMCNAAIIFQNKAQAQQVIDNYKTIRLPKNKVHSKLSIVEHDTNA